MHLLTLCDSNVDTLQPAAANFRLNQMGINLTLLIPNNVQLGLKWSANVEWLYVCAVMHELARV